MSSQLSTSFNFAAEKVVSLKEWRQKTGTLYKQELSFGEKVFLNLVDRPASVVVGLATTLNDIVTGNKVKGSYVNTSPFGLYVSGAFAEAEMKRAAPYMPNEKFQAKINGLAVQAFEQSEDHSQKPLMQTLQPL